VIVDINLRPDVFAAVMATGIISISADDHRYRLISGALAVVGTAALAVLVAVVVSKLIVRRVFAFHHLEQQPSMPGCLRCGRSRWWFSGQRLRHGFSWPRPAVAIRVRPGPRRALERCAAPAARREHAIVACAQ
jgi:hypothetical protein